MNPAVFENLFVAADAGTSHLLLFFLFIVGTFISEDLTCVTAGLLAARGVIGFFPAMVASLLGIYIGDLLLYFAGRHIGRAALSRPPLRWWVSPEKEQWSEDWFRRRGPIVILISRFVPGSRLPIYIASGMLNMPLRRVALYFGIAGLLWTPALVGLAATIGAHVMEYLAHYGRVARITVLALAIVIWMLLRLLVPMCSPAGRRMLLDRFKRLTRWRSSRDTDAAPRQP